MDKKLLRYVEHKLMYAHMALTISDPVREATKISVLYYLDTAIVALKTGKYVYSN